MKKLEMIKTYYESNMAKNLPEYGILGWESEEAQQLRFDVLLDKVNLDDKKLLDVGCGTGNLLERINSRGFNVAYTGVDILEQMIEKANKKRLNGVFVHADIFKESIFASDLFDVVYTSGIFNLNLGNNKKFLRNALELFFSLSRETVVFNLLHVESPDREDKYFYFHPGEVSEILTEFSTVIRRAEFIETYLKNDFTVICKKNK